MKTGGILVVAFALLACSSKRSDHPDFDECSKDSPCQGEGEVCRQGFCVSEGGAGVDAGGGTGEPCEQGAPLQDCYEGKDGTEGIGVCRGGQRQCVGGFYTQCLGQVVDGDEQECNGKDDDCDDEMDEFAAGCETGMSGVCAAGKLVCYESLKVCEPTTDATPETCNAEDDDCDGNTDEVGGALCFPEGAEGCVPIPGGNFECKGLCEVGALRCAGDREECNDVTVAVDEECTSGGGTAADENCNGSVDEGCPCSVQGEMRSCYGGPPGTQGKGDCKAGTQTCFNGIWGACAGQVLPSPETCANLGSDDDCNGARDDIPRLGEMCIDDTQQGICRDGTLRCPVNGEGTAVICKTMLSQMEQCDEIDQDCDGDPYNGFDFDSNEYCGNCETSCDGVAQTCCEAHCMPIERLQTDVANCGACGRACGAGQYCCQGECINGPTQGGSQVPPLPGPELCACTDDCKEKSCCYTQCVDLDNDSQNCGACGNSCNSPGGVEVPCFNGRCGGITGG